MSFFDNLFENIFLKSNDKSSGVREVLVREMVKRNKLFLGEYKDWLKADMHLGLLEYLRENHTIRIANPNASVNYFILDTSRAKGFYFRSEQPWNTKDYSFLIHFFTERLKTMDYYMNNSKREAIEEDGELKTEELFYLKPGLKFRREIPYNQLFGNVLFEHKIKDEKTELVKMVVNTYSDRNFKQAYDFEDLIRELFLF